MATLAGALTNPAKTGVLIGNTFISADDLAKVTTLQGAIAGGSSKFFCTPRKIGESVGYLVPPGKKFLVVAVQLYSNGGAVGDSFGLQSADTDVGLNSTTEPTGPDMPYASFTPWDIGLGVVSTSEAAVVNRDRTIMRVFPGNKYLLFSGATAGGAYIRIYGFELDVAATLI